jgi:hypothetical protein
MIDYKVDKKMYMLSMSLGSFAGSYVPMLWGNADMLSLSGVIFSALGGFLGIYGMYTFLDH